METEFAITITAILFLVTAKSVFYCKMLTWEERKEDDYPLFI